MLESHGVVSRTLNTSLRECRAGNTTLRRLREGAVRLLSQASLAMQLHRIEMEGGAVGSLGGGPGLEVVDEKRRALAGTRGPM